MAGSTGLASTVRVTSHPTRKTPLHLAMVPSTTEYPFMPRARVARGPRYDGWVSYLNLTYKF